MVDQGFKDAMIIHGAVKGITVEVVRRNPDDEGKRFVPQPKRWVVEQVNGTLMLHRRLARDYDHRPDNADSRVVAAGLLLRTVRERRFLGTAQRQATYDTLQTAWLAAPPLRAGLNADSARRAGRHLRALLGLPALAVTDPPARCWPGTGPRASRRPPGRRARARRAGRRRRTRRDRRTR
ncbi:hypothetical protein ACFYOP_29110 [Streptomyces sp. NPDC006294]|uniref:hypothetical protein n=1 Tax=Streptomyces sp. NPDC006294 TaxID=3364743 RepID=UPI0036A5F9F6